MMYRPKQSLSSEDGVVFFQAWKDTVKTYFKMSGHLEKTPELQKTILRTLIDAKLVKTLDADLRDSEVTTDLTNMLATLDTVFDDLYPLNSRRAALFNHRQGQENWVEWVSSLGDGWDECGMHELVMDQLKSIMAIHLTDNKAVQEELLKIPTDKLFFKEIRKIGREAQGRAIAKKGQNEVSVNRVGADQGASRGRGGSHRGGRGGGQAGNKVRCYRCNGAHYVRNCDADKSKMYCSTCGMSEEFRANPHWTGAKYCPKQGQEAKTPKANASLRMVKHKSEEDSSDGEGYETDNGDMDERAGNWSDGRKPNMFYIGMMNCKGDSGKV